MDNQQQRCKKDNSFEMKYYRQTLSLTWTERIPNEIVFSRIGIKRPTILQNIKKLMLGYFGHIKRHQSLEKIEGKRGRGKPVRRWEQDIEEWLGTTATQAGRMAEDRSQFRRKFARQRPGKGLADRERERERERELCC